MNIIFLTGGQCYASFRACLPSFPTGFHPFRQTFGPRHRSLLMLALLAAACSAPSDSSTTTTTAPSETAPPTPHRHRRRHRRSHPHHRRRRHLRSPNRIDWPSTFRTCRDIWQEQNSDGSQTKVFADDRSIRWWILKGDKVVEITPRRIQLPLAILKPLPMWREF